LKSSIDAAISRDKNVIRKEEEMALKYKDIKSELQRVWHVQTKLVSVVTPSNSNHLKIVQKMSEQHTVKARYAETTENRHFVHCTHASESAVVEVLNV
jgi:hypothetical protein